MAFIQKDFSGSLFRNDKKENEKHPDFNGNILINNKKYWLSAWVKKSTSGDSYISLSAQPVVPREATAADIDAIFNKTTIVDNQEESYDDLPPFN